MYQLIFNYDGISQLGNNGNTVIPPGGSGWDKYQEWLIMGNFPLPADVPTPEEIARQEEIKQAPLTARQYFAASPAAVAFIRLTPEEQVTQIDGMTTAQLKTVIKYLAVAVSALIKERFLD